MINGASGFGASQIQTLHFRALAPVPDIVSTRWSRLAVPQRCVMHSATFPLTTQGLTAPSRKLASLRSNCIFSEKATRKCNGRTSAHTAMTMTDWARLRADTPAVEKILHLNNAGEYTCASAASVFAGINCRLACANHYFSLHLLKAVITSPLR